MISRHSIVGPVRQPFTSAPRVAPCGCIVGSLLRAGRSRPCPQVAAPLRPAAPTSGCPLQVVDSPLAGGPWLQPAAPVRGLAMASRHLAGGLGRNRLPLAASDGQPLLAVLAANALNDSTRFNLITRSLKPIFCMKTLALIPLLGNLNGFLRSLAFGYLDEKPNDISLMKFFGLCTSALSWYLDFASVFSTLSVPFMINALPPRE
ncbi:hypothetical protein GW17_00025278 [Ensete ventricosum]|nr:hypothetical protein GW17_00025278 [Ensete ventricosum]